MEKHGPTNKAHSLNGHANARQPASGTADFLKQTLVLMGDTARMAADRNVGADAAVNAMLEAVGGFFNVSRTYVMLDEKDGRYLRNTHEWVSADTGRAMSSWPLYDYEHDLPSLKPLLQARDFLAAHARDLPPDLEQTLRKQAVESVLLVPLLRDGKWIGLAGFDSCGKKRLWSEEEILLLRHLACMAVFALERGECRALRDRLDRVRAALAEDEAAPAEQPSGMRRAPKAVCAKATPTTLREAERTLITETLRRCQGNKQRAAKQLGLTWAALDRRCKKLAIDIFKD